MWFYIACCNSQKLICIYFIPMPTDWLIIDARSTVEEKRPWGCLKPWQRRPQVSVSRMNGSPTVFSVYHPVAQRTKFKLTSMAYTISISHHILCPGIAHRMTKYLEFTQYAILLLISGPIFTQLPFLRIIYLSSQHCLRENLLFFYVWTQKTSDS